MSWLEQVLIRKLVKQRRHGLADRVNLVGTVSATLRYSELYPNSKLRGEVYRHHDLGHNLVVVEGRRIGAGLLVGQGGVAGSLGYNESTGYVLRGMALGEDGTPEADGDCAASPAGGLYAPSPGIISWDHYFPLTSITFPSGTPAGSGTKAYFTRIFAANEPSATTTNVREFGLYTAAPVSVCPQVPLGSTPVGPAGGPYLFARKTCELITLTPDFTLTLVWAIEE